VFCSLIVHVEFMETFRQSNPTPKGHLQPGQMLARGVSRHLHALGFASLQEFVPTRGLRVDVLGLGPKGELWVVECKSSRADFQSDRKWQGYLEWCDRYFWAVNTEFPVDLLPKGTGLIIADGYDAEVIRMAPEDKRWFRRGVFLCEKNYALLGVFDYSRESAPLKILLRPFIKHDVEWKTGLR